jgi:hypothetical protein
MIIIFFISFLFELFGRLKNMHNELLETILLNRISVMKEELIVVATKTGFTSTQTVICSQQLDEFLNEHMKIFPQRLS